MITIDHTSLESTFIQHLKLQHNKRTVLTGPFGTGKSTFLKQLEMNISSNSPHDFVFVKIQPVNYSIASNDDVFDLIKYDLIVELLENHGDKINLAPHAVPLILAAQMFVIDKFSSKNFLTTMESIASESSELADIFGPAGIFIQLASKINKPISALKKSFDEFKIKLSKNKDFDILKSFSDSQASTKGGYVQDPVSMVVKDMLTQIKESIKLELEEELDREIADRPIPETVLIVDDMDRLDPEHIFRLFNIFSAHYDPKDDTNKLGFDKVIFVCDLDNIKKIYHHRYGIDVDFAGYIDKFYSLEPFHFDNRKFIVDAFQKIITKLPVNENEDQRGLQIENRPRVVNILTLLCQALIKERHMNLRMIATYPAFTMTSDTVTFQPGWNKYAIEYDFLVIVNILRRFYSSNAELKDKLAKLHKYDLKSSLNQLGGQIDFEALCNIISQVCYYFVIDYRAETGSSAYGEREVRSMDGSVIFHVNGQADGPRSFERIEPANGSFKPFSLISFALDRAIETGMLR